MVNDIDSALGWRRGPELHPGALLPHRIAHYRMELLYDFVFVLLQLFDQTVVFVGG
jgi:hypothetical protein